MDDEEFYAAMEDIVVKVAANDMTKGDLKEFFSKFIKDKGAI
ncbi:hypothetical protein [uncultured Campylobacter sp.]|nr:hypothetical protein [uncultured Campylobacter sp.]